MRMILRLAPLLVVLLAHTQASAEDIDIFLAPTSVGATAPNVLFVVDNTSNWARQSQQWPDRDAQGQSEVRAIMRALDASDRTLNVGLMMFNTAGNANEDGGYIRYDIREMTDLNEAELDAQLQRIFDNINSPDEKRNSNTAYGNLMADVYNFFAGANALTPAGVPTTLADGAGYTTPFSVFESPLTAANVCAETVIIFITNPNSNGPSRDDGANTTLLESLGGNTEQLLVPDFTTTTSDPETVTLVEQTQCLDRRISQDQCLIDAGVAADCDPAAGLYTRCDCVEIGRLDCSGRQRRFRVDGVVETFEVTPTGTFSSQFRSPINADEWSRFFYSRGVPDGADSRRTIRTYTVDVFNRQQNADHTALMLSMARVGGGRYFAARSEQAIVDAILDIFADIQAVNSTFASASLPISATNRAQNENQVFIGMFRPDSQARPRWFGNLKRYQLVGGDSIQLGDVFGERAVNTTTGFITECAQSFWTFDSGNYWENLGINPSPASLCLTSGNNPFSDAPDGPRVEKGGAAQIIRSGNDPEGATDYAVNRTVYTRSGSSLVSFTPGNTGLPSNLVNFIKGADVFNEKGTGEVTSTRPSLHGDVIHSRPQPVNYGGETGVVVYYGANDGFLRAVSGETGKELWSFVAPEFFSSLGRLALNSPKIDFPGLAGDGTELPKDYYFDGSIGLARTADESQTTIYVSMRRGGRMVYAFDVSDPNTPALEWAVGCPSELLDLGCSSGMSQIGQTWSTPVAAPVATSLDPIDVVFLGGGYDDCEDEDTSLPDCSSTKGNVVYILDAATGSVIRSFATNRGVVADVSVLDMNQDGAADFAYVVDVGGNIYRIDLVDAANSFEPLASADWRMTLIAQSTGGGRKFLFAPALLPNGDRYVYLALGSGDREHPLISNYPTTEDITNRFYVFFDDLQTTGTLNLDGLSMANYTNLAAEDEVRNGVVPGGPLRGWFLGLPGAAEQTVTSAVIISGKVAFSTNRPVPDDEFSCGTNLGEARGYLLDLLNAEGAVAPDGERSNIFEGGGIPPSPVVARVPVDGQLNTVLIGVVQQDGTTSSAVESQRVRPDTSSRRTPVYWFQTGAD